jgi:hypothetical protein
MHVSILKLVVFAVLTAFMAALAIFADAFRTGDSPSDDGPRALIAEFCGIWAGIFLFFLSFSAETVRLQWWLRGLAAVAALIGIGLSVYFADSTEVSETPDKEPTGFKSKLTDLNLK